MAKLKGLGRGLDALLGSTAPVEDKLQTLPVHYLQPGKYQPRTHMDEHALADLAESIRTQGVIQPILVRELGVDRYEIIAGERRWRASQKAGLTEVPAVVRKVADEVALAMALIENIQRENLNPLEEAIGLQRLIDEFGMTHEACAHAVGKSRSAVTNLLRLLTLAEPVRDLLMYNQIDMGHARALLTLPVLKQVDTAKLVAEKGLSVRETEKLVGHLQAGKPA
ncbi:MAG: ParB/RepB/Spo0J family partition protein, partial [Burkholderiales bacterium]|nr:ParB/RepB/Spo0J family partition protein [Burkholderiales bacterium]